MLAVDVPKQMITDSYKTMQNTTSPQQQNLLNWVGNGET
jgi:hypothetical protein